MKSKFLLLLSILSFSLSSFALQEPPAPNLMENFADQSEVATSNQINLEMNVDFEPLDHILNEVEQSVFDISKKLQVSEGSIVAMDKCLINPLNDVNKEIRQYAVKKSTKNRATTSIFGAKLKHHYRNEFLVFYEDANVLLGVNDHLAVIPLDFRS